MKYYVVNGITFDGNTQIGEVMQYFQPGNFEIYERSIPTIQDFYNDCKCNVQVNDFLNAIYSVLQTGKKILAIKLVRESTEWGLRESKDFVEKRLM